MLTFVSVDLLLEAALTRQQFFGFEVRLSSIVCQAFYRHFFQDDGAKQMIDAVADLPLQISIQWAHDYDDFGAKLLRGEFVVPETDSYVQEYILHYTAGFDLDDYEETKALFDFSTAVTVEAILELSRLIEACSIIAEHYNSSSNSKVKYVGGLQHMKYIG